MHDYSPRGKHDFYLEVVSDVTFERDITKDLIEEPLAFPDEVFTCHADRKINTGTTDSASLQAHSFFKDKSGKWSPNSPAPPSPKSR